MIELTRFDDGQSVYIKADAIVAIEELPKSDKFSARTRVDYPNNCFLVKESARDIRRAMIQRSKPEQAKKGT